MKKVPRKMRSPRPSKSSNSTAFTACLENGFTEEQASNVVQAEVVAFVAVKGAKGKSKGGKGLGKDKGGKGGKKNRGFRKLGYRKGRRFPGKPRVTLEQRKAALQRLKDKSPCITCGLYGHWAGDKKLSLIHI